MNSPDCPEAQTYLLYLDARNSSIFFSGPLNHEALLYLVSCIFYNFVHKSPSFRLLHKIAQETGKKHSTVCIIAYSIAS